MLYSAHQGYIYQDIVGAYFVAQEIAQGRVTTRFHFDFKKTPSGIQDKFDDLTIYYDGTTSYIQIKYSNDKQSHVLTKQDFSSRSIYDLGLSDLYETWKALHTTGCTWRVCLAWEKPRDDDPIRTVLINLPDKNSLFPGSTCYQFNCDTLWPIKNGVLSSWRTLKKWSKSIDRAEFKAFLDCLTIETCCPKSTLLQDYTTGIEKLLFRTIEMIGIGIYPNDHLTVPRVAERLCTIIMRRRATGDSLPISCDEIAKEIKIIQSYGGIEQKFEIDEKVLVATPNRVEQVVSILEQHHAVILTAEPGAGKSWFIENLHNHLKETTNVVKHYCYIALEDPLALKRITVNVLYGSLITQILKSDEELTCHMIRRYASNLEQLNLLLGNIKKKTLLIIDGIDHIWRVYQKNRGGLTEGETRILQALALLDYTNPNVSILVVSQPIDQLSELISYQHCTLAPLPESFVEELLEKYVVPNSVVEMTKLSRVIHEKSNGNALYCKYLVDHAVIYKTYTSFEWITDLPPYDFNLTSYYKYLYEQIQSDMKVPCALCGADFSITEIEMQQITHLGNIVSSQLALLKPILRYTSALGYSIYHESFKRFVIDTINQTGASIEYLIYLPLIEWLETHSFYESTKAYGHLLKLYYEVDAFDKIARTISEDFIENSLYNAQPFHCIIQNYNLQKTSLQYVDGFVPMIIIAEQSKIIYEIKQIAGQILIQYLNAVQIIHGEDKMYRVLWDGEHLLIDTNDALRFLTNQVHQGIEVVHWSIIPILSKIPYEILGLVAVKLINTKQYERFDELIKNVYEDPKHKKAFYDILNELEWLSVHVGDDWKKNTPYFRDILSKFKPSVPTLKKAVEQIISNDKFIYDDKWEIILRDIIMLIKVTNSEEIEAIIKSLSNYNWFRNWIIYLIKITELSQREYTSEDLISAFSYLVRDLQPFKGTPRVCDLYKQLPFIKKTFHQGLLLCKGNENLLIQCCELLEKVATVTTSLQRSYSGPMTREDYLELITSYLPGEYVIDKYKEYYAPLGSKMIYLDVAEIAFKYTIALSNSGKEDEAKQKYIEGIQAITAYGFRKDRTLSEVLYSSVPYQKAYGTLGVEWFFELYKMATTVVTHTDGRSTSSYPIEWFKEFTEVYPDESLRFLASETLESPKANWHQEDEFNFILEEYASLFNPTQWFLLCRSLPLASSRKIITNGLADLDKIDETLREVYQRWLQYIPGIIHVKDGSTEVKENSADEIVSLPKQFIATTKDEVLSFLETNSLSVEHAINLQKYFLLITNWEEKKEILRQVVKSFRYGRDVGKWVDDLFKPESPEWIYLSVCLFVFARDGWYHGLHYTHYLKRAYEVDAEKTIEILKENLGYYISDNDYSGQVSCNLINALSELKYNEVMVKELLQTTFQIVKRRLPHPPNAEINMSIYQRLEGFSRDEMVVTLLIARLNTLTTEKIQGIIWSLTYIAQTSPKTIIRPYCWAFSNRTFLLPIHRALLLQILIEYTDHSIFSDELLGQLIGTFPTGFFLEDQYIRSLIDYKIELDEKSSRSILLPAHQHDAGFFPYIHIKYRTLRDHFGLLTGTFNAYSYKRDKLSKENESYFIRNEEVMTPIVSLANAAYEIINTQYYGYLKELTFRYNPSYICNLRFYLEEIIIQVGALTKRPPNIPMPEEFPSFEIRKSSSLLENDGWVVLASIEKELYGEHFKPKRNRSSSLVLSFDNKIKSGGDLFSQYIFRANQYFEQDVNCVPFDQPICLLTIADTLEQSCVIYVSPFIIRKLGLTMDSILHKGFQAFNDKGEVIIKLITWKEEYYGSISDGTEYPRLAGVAVIIRSDYYKRLLHLNSKESCFILSQDFSS